MGRLEPTPQRFIDSLLEDVLAAFKKLGSHPTVLFVDGKDSTTTVVLPLGSDPVLKRALMFTAGLACASMQPNRIAFISEGWLTLKVPTGEKQIKGMSDAQECLYVVIQDNQGTAESVVVPFTRVCKEVYLGKTIYPEETHHFLIDAFREGVKWG